jgi:hypothetical protein
VANTLRALDTSVNGNGAAEPDESSGIQVVHIGGRRLTVNGDFGSGIRADSLLLQGLVAQGNSGAGIEVFTRASLRDSTVVSNDGLGAGVDLLMYRNYPRLVTTTRGRSARSDGSTLGVCANDP